MSPLAFIYWQFTVSYTGMVAARVVFSLYALQLGAAPWEVGVLAAVNQVFPLVLAFGFGVAGDRYGARWLLFAGSLAGTVGLALPAAFPGMPALYAGSVLCGLWSSFYLVLTQGLVGKLSEREALMRNMNNYGALAASTLLTGPLLAGFVIDAIGHRAACLVLAPAALGLAVHLAGWGGALPGGERSKGGERPAPAAGVGAGAVDTAGRTKLADREFVRLVAITCAVQLALDLYPFCIPVYGHALGLSASTIGTIIGASALAALAMRFSLTPLVARFGAERLLLWSNLAAACAFMLIPLFSSPAALVAVSLLYGVGIAGGHPITGALILQRTPKSRAGEATGLRIMWNSAVRVVGPPAFGAITATLGLAAGFVAVGAALATAGVALARRRG